MGQGPRPAAPPSSPPPHVSSPVHRPRHAPRYTDPAGPGPTRGLPLIDHDATSISIDGDISLAQHWLDNTAHISG